MTMSSDRRSRGKLVLLSAFFVSLLHAASAVIKLGHERVETGLATSRIGRRANVDSDDYDLVVSTPGDSTVYSNRHDKSGKGGVEQVAKCYNSCLATNDGEPSPTLPQTSHSEPEKPECCKGGVSFVKMLYQGSIDGTIYLNSTGYNVVNACNRNSRADIEARKHKDDGAIVKFVSCSECFPDGSSVIQETCDFSSDSVDVVSGTEVCLAVFDTSNQVALSSKMPTNLDLFFGERDGTNQVVQTTLHTSCSKPIYSPYAIRLDYCESDGYPFFLDVSIIDIDSMVNHPVLIFIDGVGAKFPTSLFTNCKDDDYEKDKTCCKGGATLLKVRAGVTTIPGTLTFNEALAADCDFADDSDESSSKGGGSKSGNDGAVRFVSCDDDCLHPFSDLACAESFDQWDVIAGEDVCFGSWNEETNRIDFGSKMPTNLEMFFVPDEIDSFPVQSAFVHTSCSKPVYPNWAAVFARDCDSSDSTLVHLDQVDATSLGFHLAFIDGVSRGYYEAAKEVGGGEGASFFDVNFADCGCNCNATAFPTEPPSPTGSPPTPSRPRPNPPRPPTPSPIADSPPTTSPTYPPTDPTGSPTAAPVSPPTNEYQPPPTITPPRPGPPPEDCEAQCAQWVYEHCIDPGDDGTFTDEPCDITKNPDGEGRFLRATLRELSATQDDISSLSPVEQIKFHDDMAKLYDSLLALLLPTAE